MYDVIILGSGPAGLTAGIYAARGGLKCAILAGPDMGGQPTKTHIIENYSGAPKVEGFTLVSTMIEQATSFGVEMVYSSAVNTKLDGKVKEVVCDDGVTLKAKVVIVASGANGRKLDIENEKELVGKGVAYCATCDGGFFKDEVVAINGGGNTALTSALYLSKICKKVYLIHRRQGFRGTQILVDRIRETNNIELVLDCVVTQLIGEPLDSIVVHNVITKENKNLNVKALFVSIGTIPNIKFLNNQLELSDDNYVITNSQMQTNLDGVFAAGDVRTTPLKQVITACGDGAIAAESAIAYLALQ